MPRRYVSKSKRKIRNRVGYRKRRTRRTPRIPMFKMQTLNRTGFPRTTVVKLRYVDGFTLDPTNLGIAATHVFRANSIFDPNVTSAGHQPMNRDMWANLYKRYTVIGSKITLRVFNSITTTSHGMLAGVLLDEDANINDLTPATLMEQGLIKYTMGASSTLQNSGRGLIVSKTFSAKKFFNVADVSDNKDLGAYQAANPVRTAKFHCIVSPTPGSSVDMAVVQCVVIIDYIVLFSEPLEQPAS